MSPCLVAMKGAQAEDAGAQRKCRPLRLCHAGYTVLGNLRRRRGLCAVRSGAWFAAMTISYEGRLLRLSRFCPGSCMIGRSMRDRGSSAKKCVATEHVRR